ncbi:MAG: UPF0280 family protein [Dissulfurimicrobium sp.]|uniref:UPF0280 family protein n=1 Tax=Dissulfurimicrobium sp. TaxID=2022436 RepID=UPI00404AE58A
MGERRTYRTFMAREGLVSFEVRHKETDLHVQAKRDLSSEVSGWVIEARLFIEEYGARHPDFLRSYVPIPEDHFAPPVVREMIAAAQIAGVGPMAAVAGAVAEYVGARCALAAAGDVIVENGGDIFISIEGASLISVIWAGKSPLSGKVGLRIRPEMTPIGLCTSSGTVGHSRSFGMADAVTILSRSTALADAAATAVGNMVKTDKDIDAALKAMGEIAGVMGGVIIKGTKLGAWGAVELVPVSV